MPNVRSTRNSYFWVNVNKCARRKMRWQHWPSSTNICIVPPTGIGFLGLAWRYCVCENNPNEERAAAVYDGQQKVIKGHLSLMSDRKQRNFHRTDMSMASSAEEARELFFYFLILIHAPILSFIAHAFSPQQRTVTPLERFMESTFSSTHSTCRCAVSMELDI